MKTAVLLVNFGGPRKIDDVPLFLRNLTGRDLPEPLQQAVIERYQAIGGGSPLADITEQQAALLSAGSPELFFVKAAFRYSRPLLEEIINECYLNNVERIAFLIMSPFYTSRTVGSYITAAESYLSLLPYRPRTLFIHSWYKEPLFIDSWIRLIKEQSPEEKFYYLFTAHSLPRSVAEPYRVQVEDTVKAVAGTLQLSRYGLGWQSAAQDAEEPWIGPSVETVIDSVSGKTDGVVEVPIGFVSDHLETLYDIDRVHRHYASVKGLMFSRIPSLNTYPPFINALCTILEKGLQEGP